MTATARRNVAIQMVLLTLLVASFIWFGRKAFPGSTAVFAVLLILLLLWSHRERGDSLRELGFRLDTAPRTARLFAPIAVFIVAITLSAGLWMHSLRFPALPVALLMLAKLMLFGIAQQYILLGFYHRGITRLVSAPPAALFLTALVFAAFHLPNPFLTLVTLVAATIAVAIYQRSPNLWVTGLTHGVISFFLYYSLPVSLTAGLRVGPDY